MKLSKPNQYLIAVGCTEPADPNRRRPAGTPDVLTHTQYELVTTRDPANAQARADAMAVTFGQRCAIYPTRGPVTVLSVAPAKYRPARMCADRPGKRSDDEEKRRAMIYVRWLAARDGITLPTRGEVRLEWDSVDSKTRTRVGKGWDHERRCQVPRTWPIQERRIRAVTWGHNEERYNTRKDGRRGAWSHNEYVVDFRFDLPNWDFEPDIPVEEILPDDSQPDRGWFTREVAREFANRIGLHADA